MIDKTRYYSIVLQKKKVRNLITVSYQSLLIKNSKCWLSQFHNMHESTQDAYFSMKDINIIHIIFTKHFLAFDHQTLVAQYSYTTPIEPSNFIFKKTPCVISTYNPRAKLLKSYFLFSSEVRDP